MCKYIISHDFDKIVYFPKSKINLKYIIPLIPNNQDKLSCVKRYLRMKIARQPRSMQPDSSEPNLKNDEMVKYLIENNILGEVPSLMLSQLELDDLEDMILTGLQLNTYLPNLKLSKVINHKREHNGFKFTVGLNDDNANFNPFWYCSNGLYFSTSPKKWGYKYECDRMQCYLSDVSVPPDAIVKIERGKLKSNLIILGEFRDYNELISQT